MALRTIWKSITQTTPEKLIAGYSKLIQERIDHGFDGYFLSLITVPDWPVHKKEKQRLSDLKINNGLHLHGILCVPWTSRLKVGVPSHFKTKEALYVKNHLLRIDVEPIYSVDVVDYAFKSLKNRTATDDDIQAYH